MQEMPNERCRVVMKALGHLPGLSMLLRTQTGLFSPALECLQSLSQALALHPKCPGVSPHPAWSHSASYMLTVFSHWCFPSQSSSLQALPSPLPLSSSLPSKAQSGLVPRQCPLQGALGTHPTTSAPLKGTAAPRGQGGSAPEMGDTHGTRRRKSGAPCMPCSPLQQILSGLALLHSIPSPQTSTRAQSCCSQKVIFISDTLLLW